MRRGVADFFGSEMHFGFRKPYQVLSVSPDLLGSFSVSRSSMLTVVVDSEMLVETERLKMDMLHLLKKTLHGDLKPRTSPSPPRHHLRPEKPNNRR